ncbi:unnamed protein product [Ascophyllum nodosum]
MKLLKGNGQAATVDAQPSTLTKTEHKLYQVIMFRVGFFPILVANVIALVEQRAVSSLGKNVPFCMSSIHRVSNPAKRFLISYDPTGSTVLSCVLSIGLYKFLPCVKSIAMAEKLSKTSAFILKCVRLDDEQPL